MRISFRKIKHLYVVYGLWNFLLIVSIILSLFYLSQKQSTLFHLENKLVAEIMNLAVYKSTAFNFALESKLEEEFYLNGTDNQSADFMKQISKSKQIIIDIKQDLSTNNIHLKENLHGLISDYEIIESQNELLLDYIRRIGNSEHGALLNIKNAADDFQLKLNSYSEGSKIKENLSQSILLINILARNRDNLILEEIEAKMDKMKKDLLLSDSTSNNYMNLRLADSYENFENYYRELAKTILEIGVSDQKGLLKVIDDRFLTAKIRMQQAMKIIQDQKSDIEFTTFLILSVLFIIVVAFNFGSALFFIQNTRNFTWAVNEHFKALNQGEFVKIDKSKVPKELQGPIDGLENFANKFIASGKYLKLLSSGNGKAAPDKSMILDLFYPSILQLNQRFEALNNQIVEERKKQAEIQWIKEGIDKLTEVMRQEFDNPLLHSNKIIYSLVQYLDIPMGAIYHTKDEDGKIYLEMAASFAYGKEKQLYRKILLGEGMVGSAASEKKTLNLTNVPESYFNLISGFSESKPKNIIVSPIKLNDQIYGVIELASLSRFKDEEIRFVEEVCKAAAYSFALSKVYMDTLYLYEGANLEIAQLKSENESLNIDNEDFKINYKNLKEQNTDNDYIVDKLNEFAIMINLDLDGNILEVNSRFEQFFKAEKKKFLHSNYREYMMEASNDFDFENIWRDLRAGFQHELNQKVIIANHEFWLNQHYFPMKDSKGRVKGIKIMAFDITDKMNLENQLIDLKPPSI